MDAEEALQMVRPGDLLLFSGTDFVSKTIRGLQSEQLGLPDDGRRVFSHCGVVLNGRTVLDLLNVEDPDEPLVYESTATGRWIDRTVDVESGSGVFGVQMRRLRDALRTYDGVVAWCRLRQNPLDRRADENEDAYLARTEAIAARLTDLHHRLYHRGYDFSPVALLAALFPSLRSLRGVGPSFGGEDRKFCSELAALVYQEMGVLSPTLDSESVVPMDYMGFDRDTHGVPAGLFDDPIRLLVPPPA